MLAPARLPSREPGDSDRFRVELPTDISRLGEVVETVRACCFDTIAPTRRTQFRLCTVVAEAVANAMLYGNDGDARRRVIIDVEVAADRLVIAVSDEGDGFDHRVIPQPPEEESVEATRGRGLFMIHRLADRVVFNDRGNTIWMTLPRR